MADSLKNNISNGMYCKESSEAYKPCLKHAAENLSQKSKSDGNSKVELCNSCSNTMLSYISLIQDMLGGLARKFSKDEDTSCCSQCWKQESQSTEDLARTDSNNKLKSENFVISNVIANGEREIPSYIPIAPESKDEIKTSQKIEQEANSTVTHAAEVTSEPKRPRKVSSRRNSRRISREVKENVNEVYPERCASRNGWQTDFLYNVSSSIEPKYIPYNQQHESENMPAPSVNKENDIIANHEENELINHRSRSSSLDSSPLTSCSPSSFFDNRGPSSKADSGMSLYNSNFNKAKVDDSTRFDYNTTENNSPCHNKPEADDFAKPEFSIIENVLNRSEAEENDSAKSDYSGNDSNSSHCEADIDDSLKSDYSGTESFDRRVYGMGMKPAENGKTVDQNAEEWKTLHDSFSNRVVDKDRESLEAFVSICRNNAEALGCLVLGSSLLLSRTSRKLCVLVFDEVDPAFKEPLSSIFHVVQHVRHLKSIDERKLKYLKQMDLEKLNVWCLVQFSKCVFLNPDCLILRNCDELFQHEELSAVPDIGWPDCFNSGVFVFAPSVNTLSKLVELSQKQGQNNEGDQMLLNAYFNSWSCDIGKKLSFIYNLMRNVSYSYDPAFQRFGPNVKIVQFLGGSKPWEVKFCTQTGELESGVDVHPKHVRFFSEWINTFKLTVLKLFPQDVYTFAFNQRSVSAEDIGLALCFPTFYKDQRSVKPIPILPKRRSVPPFYFASPPSSKTPECNASLSTPICCQFSDISSVEEAAQILITSGCIQISEKEDDKQNGKIEDETVLEDSSFNGCLPGAIIGDYQGMKAWEQGHIDYEGCDSSENIMNRLSFLIHRSVQPNL